MATKKQKREAGTKKREEFLLKVKQDGLRAQKLDHLRQEAERAAISKEVAEINTRYRQILARHGINE